MSFGTRYTVWQKLITLSFGGGFKLRIINDNINRNQATRRSVNV